MKQSKLLAFLLMAVLTMGVFTACSDDDDDGNLNSAEQALIGRWEYEKIDYSGRVEKDIFIFNKNHTGSFDSDEYETYYEYYSDPFTWSADETTLTLKYKSDGYEEKILYSISGNKLTLNFGGGDYGVYTKK